MMQKTKFALAFLTGAVYTSAWWSLFVIPFSDAWKGLVEAIVFVGSASILTLVIASLVLHWND